MDVMQIVYMIHFVSYSLPTHIHRGVSTWRNMINATLNSLNSTVVWH